MWPQYVYLALLIFGLGLSLANHGKTRSDESFWVTFFSASLGFFLLYMGGFFKGM